MADPSCRQRAGILCGCNEGVANRYFEEIEELEDALGARCVALCEQPELIRSYTRYHWWPKVA